MNRGISHILNLLDEATSDEILCNFLKQIIRKEAYDSSGWYTDEYDSLIESCVGEDEL